MSETPLRRYLSAVGSTAEEFASAHGFSPWSVRHWARGDKVPQLEKQRELAAATHGVVTPAAWATWAANRPVDITTHTELAAMLGLNQSTVSRLERGALDLDARTALALEALKARAKPAQPEKEAA